MCVYLFIWILNEHATLINAQEERNMYAHQLQKNTPDVTSADFLKELSENFELNWIEIEPVCFCLRVKR